MYLGAKLQNRFIFSTIVTRKFNHFTFFVDMHQLPLRFFPLLLRLFSLPCPCRFAFFYSCITFLPLNIMMPLYESATFCPSRFFFV